MAEIAHPAEGGAHGSETSRRDFLTLAAAALGAVGIGSVAWPFIDSMNPAADILAAGAPVDVDISKLQPGQQILVVWRGHPIFIMHRTAEQLTMLQSARDTGLLSDPDSDQLQQAEYAKNWHRSIKPEHLVLVGVCTHLGCIPQLTAAPGGDLGPSWPGGYFCHCHGSKYDLSGRVFRGVPAPLNLPVPPYTYASDTVLRVGQNPPNATFDLNSVEQI